MSYMKLKDFKLAKVRRYGVQCSVCSYAPRFYSFKVACNAANKHHDKTNHVMVNVLQFSH